MALAKESTRKASFTNCFLSLGSISSGKSDFKGVWDNKRREKKKRTIMTEATKNMPSIRETLRENTFSKVLSLKIDS